MSRTVSLLVLLLAVGCASAPKVTEPAVAPRLFTVEQLRQGIARGRIVELRMEVAGKPTTIEHWEFTDVDEETATIHAITRDEAGTVLANQIGRSKWTELHDHAKFPAATTTIQDGVVLTVPAGTFTTRLYTVRDGKATSRFWFAVDLPGPPVQFTTEQDGKVVFRGTMLRAR